jgi:hypothetical protein
VLKHLAIAASIAVLVAGFSVGYVFATISLNSSGSGKYKLANGNTVPFSYAVNITIDTITLTAADHKKILSQACSEAARDIAVGDTR